METSEKKVSAAQELAKCAIFVVLMTVAAYIKIPFWPVPLSFQTVICVLAGLLLGWKYGALSMLCYLMLGLVGVPVFTKGFCRCRGNGGRDRASEQYAVVPAHDLCLSRGDVRRLSVRHDLLLLYMAFLYARFGCLGGALDVQYFVYFQGYRALRSGGAARQKTFADRQ